MDVVSRLNWEYNGYSGLDEMVANLCNSDLLPRDGGGTGGGVRHASFKGGAADGQVN